MQRRRRRHPPTRFADRQTRGRLPVFPNHVGERRRKASRRLDPLELLPRRDGDLVGQRFHECRPTGRVDDSSDVRLLLEEQLCVAGHAASELTEWEFIANLCKRCDCEVLLDVNNVYVSAFNHEFDPKDFLRGIPRERVRQFHLAGHTNNGTHIVDTHDHPIIGGVWDLYAEAVRLFPDVPTMIERDANIPPYAELLAELDEARRIATTATRQAA